MDTVYSRTEIIQITITRTHNGRLSTSSAELDLSAWSATSLFRKSILHQVASWELGVASSTKVFNVQKGINHLSKKSIQALNQELSSLTRECVGALLQGLDEDFAPPALASESLAARYYFAIRSLLVRTPGELKDGLTFAQAAAPYIRNIRQRKQLRLPSCNLPSAIGQIGHTDLLDLRRQTEKSLQQRRRLIEQAAENDIRAYEETFALQRGLLAEQPNVDTARSINEWITYLKDRDSRPFPICTPRQFASVVLRRIHDEPPELTSKGWPIGLRLPKKLAWSEVPQAQLYRHKVSIWPWFYVGQRLPNSVLTAIFILILSHTGWNQGSVGLLTVDMITALPGGGYRLQSYKGKTDDETPVSEIPRYLALTCKAVDLLLWNYHELSRLRLIASADEKRLWFGWQRDSFKTTLDVISRIRIQSLCTRNGIETFQPSELRPIKAALTYLPQRDLEAVRVLLGHADLITSDAYLENTLFFRLNESMMLEFQRRIEATLTYAVGGQELVAQRSLKLHHVDSILSLIPTGDGGACANFFDGPNLSPVEMGEPCAGLACHSGEGCKNYRLVVDETTLEMAMRTRHYYRSRWQTLYERNPGAFTELHLPKLLYIYVLLKLVHEQRPDLYAKAERIFT